MDLQFSVAMCVYGGDNPAFFREAIESVFNQSRMPDEVVLTVDGPIPVAIEKIISDVKCRFSQLKIVKLQKNMGHGIARRTGIDACTKPYIAIADADDINFYTRFEKEIDCFEKDRGIDVVGSSHIKFISDPANVVAISRRPEFHDDIINLMKKKCPITQACAMFSKAIYDKAGGYIDWYCGEDYYLWIRMYEVGAKFYNCPDNLVAVRTSNDQYKRRGGWKYFKSTCGLSKYMMTKGIINRIRHILNIVPRFIIQVILPPKIRGVVRNIFIQKQERAKEAV